VLNIHISATTIEADSTTKCQTRTSTENSYSPAVGY